MTTARFCQKLVLATSCLWMFGAAAEERVIYMSRAPGNLWRLGIAAPGAPKEETQFMLAPQVDAMTPTPRGTLLAVAYRDFHTEGPVPPFACEIDAKGAVLWEFRLRDEDRTSLSQWRGAHMLKNGHFLLTVERSSVFFLREVNREGRVVHEEKLSEEAFGLQPYGEEHLVGFDPESIKIFGWDGKLVSKIPLPDLRTARVIPLPEGRLLVLGSVAGVFRQPDGTFVTRPPDDGDGRLVEITPEGRIVHEAVLKQHIETGEPLSSAGQLLPSGNLLLQGVG